MGANYQGEKNKRSVGSTLLPDNISVVNMIDILKSDYGIPKEISQYVMDCMYYATQEHIDENTAINVGNFLLFSAYVRDNSIRFLSSVNYMSGRALKWNIIKKIFNRTNNEEDIETWIAKEKSNKITKAVRRVREHHRRGSEDQKP